MLGDGCLSTYSKKGLSNPVKCITITGSSQDDLSFFTDVVCPLLIKFRGKETKIRFRKDCNAIEFKFSDVNLFNFIHSFGFPIGKKGNKLYIPEIFYDLNLVKYIISGFFATDGSVVLTKNPNKYYPRLELHTISKDLVFESFQFLSSIGMKGHFYECKRKLRDKRWKNVQTQFRFQFNGKENLVLFNKEIGFINPKYQDKFISFLDYDLNYKNKWLHRELNTGPRAHETRALTN